MNNLTAPMPILCAALNACNEVEKSMGVTEANLLMTVYFERGLTGLAREILKPKFDTIRIKIQGQIARFEVDYDALLTRARRATKQHDWSKTFYRLAS